VNLETTAGYLKSTKADLYETLKKSYVENVDYKVTPLPTKGRGRRRMQILLTPDCFKLLCMQSKSKNAQQVRLYFLEVEKTLTMYKDEIYETMMKRVQEVESNLKPIVPEPVKGAVYVLKANEVMNPRKVHDIIYKIGSATGKRDGLKGRLTDHMASRADNNQLEVVYVYKTENAKEVERCLKSLLKRAQYRKYKEVYRIDIEIIKDLINKRCAPAVNKIEQSLLKTEFVKKGALSVKRGGENSELYAVLVRGEDM
jgi:phage anti-repressor protein